jgi:hypothetical protein
MNIAGASQRWEPVAPFVQGMEQPSVNVPGVVAFFADAPRRPANIVDVAASSGFGALALESIDAVVKGWAPARAWIASDAVKVLSAGELEMHRR